MTHYDAFASYFFVLRRAIIIDIVMSVHEDQLEKTDLSVSMLLDRAWAIYGKPGSGKSSIIKHMLYVLREYVSVVIVFSLSEGDNNAYSKSMVPRCLVHDAVSEDVIRSIAMKQRQRREVYEKANDLAVLRLLYDRVASREQLAARDELQQGYEQMCKDKVPDEETELVFKEQMRKFMRAVINANRERIQKDISVEEKFSLCWMNFNPRIVVIFDDCTTELSRLKSCADVLETIFRGRHFFCTVLIASHGESVMLPIMRSSMRGSIFTDPMVARQSVQRGTNAYDKTKKSELLQYAERIHTESPYTKMVIYADKPFLFTAPIHAPFSAVSESVRAYCEKASKKEKGEMEPWMRNLIPRDCGRCGPSAK